MLRAHPKRIRATAVAPARFGSNLLQPLCEKSETWLPSFEIAHQYTVLLCEGVASFPLSFNTALPCEVWLSVLVLARIPSYVEVVLTANIDLPFWFMRLFRMASC